MLWVKRVFLDRKIIELILKIEISMDIMQNIFEESDFGKQCNCSLYTQDSIQR